MRAAAEILEEFGVPFELTIVSAHRTPARMFEYASTAAARGLRVIIAGAGGAAHLPGMVAALTPLPVIGVPVKSSASVRVHPRPSAYPRSGCLGGCLGDVAPPQNFDFVKLFKRSVHSASPKLADLGSGRVRPFGKSNKIDKRTLREVKRGEKFG